MSLKVQLNARAAEIGSDQQKEEETAFRKYLNTNFTAHFLKESLILPVLHYLFLLNLSFICNIHILYLKKKTCWVM